MNYQKILENYNYIDSDSIFHRISKANKEDYQENCNIINEIILWKTNRVTVIDNNVIKQIYELSTINDPTEAAESQLTLQVIVQLLDSKGVRLPMASTILHFYHPKIYPIIDQRAYRELYQKEFPKYVSDNMKLAHIYMRYIKDCYQFQQEKCQDIPFEHIDKVLYQIDKEKGNKVKY